MNKQKLFRIAAVSAALWPTTALAAEDLEQVIAQRSLWITGVASVVLLLLIGAASLSKKRSNGIFALMVLTVIGTSAFLIGSTIYLNTISSSKGPVHWHADTEIWACGQELDLQDPVGKLSNKIGTSTLHEHNDKRIHLEGVVVHREDASLGKFFKVIGGEISSNSIVVPTTKGKQAFISGQPCNGQPAELQVFVYSTNEDKTYSQSKVTNPASYIISAHSQVPAGDCIIIEFDKAKASTDKICRSYKVAESIGKLKGAAK